MTDTAVDPAAIAADAVALAELDGGTGRERVRIDWLLRRLHDAPGGRRVDDAGNLVWAFGPPPYRLAVLVHVDDVFGEATHRRVTERDGWLSGPGIGDNAVAIATAVAVAEHGLGGHSLAGRELPLVIVFTVGEEGLGGLRGARHACRELAPEAVLALEGHGIDRVFTDAVGSLRVQLTVTGPGGHSWWDRGRPSAVHELVRLPARDHRVGFRRAAGQRRNADGSTDANAALAAGIPAVALGCCEGENMHAPNERIRADSIATGARQLSAVLQELLELTPRAARN